MLKSITAALIGAAVASPLQRFVIVSQPTLKSIKYLPAYGVETDGIEDPWKVLLDGGLSSPYGLAVDQRQGLYVADRDSASVYRYQLAIDGDELTVVGDPETVASETTTSWVSVDDLGNVFFTDEAKGEVLGVTARQLSQGDSNAFVVYNDAGAVSSPAGIVADNFNVHWANGHADAVVGSVVKGAQPVGDRTLAPTVAPKTIAHNANKVFGLCETPQMLYYTGDTTFVWGVKKDGGNIGTVSDKLSSPRQCAYDGDGTVYVADYAAGKVYSFAGNMVSPHRAPLSSMGDISLPFGVAVVSSQTFHSAAPSATIVVPLLTIIMSTLFLRL